MQVKKGESFGEFVRNLRNEKGFTQNHLGTLLAMSETAFNRVENGRSNFPHDKLEKLAEILEAELQLVQDKFAADQALKAISKYKYSDQVFAFAEAQAKYIKSKKIKQGVITFKHG